MQVRIFATLLIATGSACADNRNQEKQASSCLGHESDWLDKGTDPPNSVATFAFKILPRGVELNKRYFSDDEAIVNISRFNDLQPRAYIRLEKDKSVSCERVSQITRKIEEQFDCVKNNCVSY